MSPNFLEKFFLFMKRINSCDEKEIIIYLISLNFKKN